MANLIATLAARTALRRQEGTPGGSPPSGGAAGAHTLAIDIGGSHLKAGVLDPAGKLVAGPNRVETPLWPAA
jgi:hypothetical protein